MQKIVTYLWFDGQIEEALEFYTSLLPDSRILEIIHYSEVGPGSPDEIMFAEFELAGQRFTLVNGNTFFKPNAAMSLCINCDSQAEIDRLWEAMTTDGGAESVAGWLTDRFGVSWQVSSTRLHEMLASDDAAAVARATRAFMEMKKLDIAKLEQAFGGE
jgi:predicted 3-demethylubiquinone-9 3-methyltransferase (glyoxalase superfamily)